VLASTLPDFGSPDTPAFVSIAIGCVFTAYAFWRKEGREDIMWTCFVGTFVGAGVGLLVYAIGLITGLY